MSSYCGINVVSLWKSKVINQKTIINEISFFISDIESSKTIDQLNHKKAFIDGSLFVSQFLLSEENLNYLYQLSESVYEDQIEEIS